MKRNTKTYLYRHFFKTRSADRDLQRQEFILNVLVFGLLCLSSAAFLTVSIVSVVHQNNLGIGPIVALVIFIGLLVFCHRLIRTGKIRLVAYLLLLLLSASTTSLLFTWGVALPQMLLNAAMIIVMAGILINARVGLIASGCVALVVTLVGVLQISGRLHPDTAWRQEASLYSDAVGYALVLLVIGLISWLSNREIDRSLARARRSEAELLDERDNLEIKVAERTQELELLQLTRIMELERFASFGRVNATLVHDMANPLMAASFSLQQLNVPDRQQLKQVGDNLAQIERHLQAARQQLRGQSERSLFNVDQELRKVIRMIRLRASVKAVSLPVPARSGLKLYGDPLKFNQIISNLITNAVESYEKLDVPDAAVEITVTPHGAKGGVRIVVTDHGAGIMVADRVRIFEPFFSKRRDSQGAGIGLSIVKQFIENEFDGTISVRSTIGAGSRFTVTLYPAAAS